MNQEIQTIIISLVATIVSVLLSFSVRLINIKTKEIKQRTQDKTLNKYIDLGKELIENSVIAIEQTFVEPLKKAEKFDDIKAKEAFDKCKLQILTMLNPPIKKAILSISSDLDKFIDTNIEAYVKKNKNIEKKE